MSSTQGGTTLAPNGPGTLTFTGESSDHDITLKYFSSGPYIVKRDFVSPKAKKIEQLNYDQLAKSTIQSHRIYDEAGTGSDIGNIKEQI